MKASPIYFRDEKWEKIEQELSDIKALLMKVLATVGERPDNQEDVLLSAPDVARLLDIDVATVYAKCAKGAIPHFKIGKRYKFRKTEIYQWIEKRNENPDIDIDEYVNRYLQNHVIKG